jgi:hypothetical protein
MTPMITGHIVECNNCHVRTVVADGDGQNVHDALNCGCCGSDHKHADPANANMTTGRLCRSVTVSANAVAVPALGVFS